MYTVDGFGPVKKKVEKHIHLSTELSDIECSYQTEAEDDRFYLLFVHIKISCQNDTIWGINMSHFVVFICKEQSRLQLI